MGLFQYLIFLRIFQKKYEKSYQQAGDLAVNKGKDFHDDNPYEESAEKWAKKELSKWLKK